MVDYLDANVFVLAAVDAGPKGEAARTVLRRCGRAPPAAATASLTVDEVAWALRRFLDRGQAVAEAGRLLRFRGLRILPVTRDTVELALPLMADGLRPRDAIHAACAKAAACRRFVSDDADFAKVRGLSRVGLVS